MNLEEVKKICRMWEEGLFSGPAHVALKWLIDRVEKLEADLKEANVIPHPRGTIGWAMRKHTAGQKVRLKEWPEDHFLVLDQLGGFTQRKTNGGNFYQRVDWRPHHFTEPCWELYKEPEKVCTLSEAITQPGTTWESVTERLRKLKMVVWADCSAVFTRNGYPANSMGLDEISGPWKKVEG